MIEEKKLISIIIPVYNAEKTIKNTLLSFSEQSCKSFKLVIVNDGSTDNSGDIIKSFCSERKLDVVYSYQHNQGVSAARNNGLSLVDTDYIMFCDADDEYHLETIRYIVNSLNNGDYDVLGIGHTRTRKVFDSNPSVSRIITDIEVLKEEILFKNQNYNFVDFCYKTDIIRKNNILFDVSLKYGEDELFIWEYITYCRTIYKTDIPYYFYLDNLESSTKHINRNRTQVIESQKKAFEYLTVHNDSFAPMISKYGIPRAKIAILKEFAQSHNLNDFEWLTESKEYECNISNLLSYKDLRIKIAALFYCISPKLFYKLLS